MAHPGIEERISEIHEDVDQYVPRRDDQHGTLHGRIVPRGDGLDHVASEPGPGEDHLDEDRPAQHVAELEADHRHRRDQGVPERMPPDDRAFGQPLRPGGPNVVLAEHVEHAGAGEARDVGDRKSAKRERRQEEVPGGARARRGQEAEPYGEEELQQDAQDERRRDHAGEREPEARAVPPGPPPDCGHDAGRNADRHRDADGGERQLKALPEPFPDLERHRSAGPDGLPEIAAAQAGDEDPVLDGERSIEAELTAEMLDVLLRRAVPGEDQCGVARDEPDGDKDDERDPDQDGHRGEEPGQEIAG
jgi:hypothetical protein